MTDVILDCSEAAFGGIDFQSCLFKPSEDLFQLFDMFGKGPFAYAQYIVDICSYTFYVSDEIIDLGLEHITRYDHSHW